MSTETSLQESIQSAEVSEFEEKECIEGIADDNKAALEGSLLVELEASRREIEHLSAIIAERDRVEREQHEFARLFPSVSLDDIPDAVKQAASERSIPLIAAYALYARERELFSQECDSVTQSAAMRSTGRIGGGSAEGDFYTIDQIRAMTPREVRKNYRTIMKSLNKISN